MWLVLAMGGKKRHEVINWLWNKLSSFYWVCVVDHGVHLMLQVHMGHEHFNFVLKLLGFFLDKYLSKTICPKMILFSRLTLPHHWPPLPQLTVSWSIIWFMTHWVLQYQTERFLSKFFITDLLFWYQSVAPMKHKLLHNTLSIAVPNGEIPE